jgi:hypothetical protein
MTDKVGDDIFSNYVLVSALSELGNPSGANVLFVGFLQSSSPPGT